MPLHPFTQSTKQKQYPAATLVSRDPTTAAAVAKLVPSQHGQTYDQEGKRSTSLLTTQAFRASLQKRARRNSDALTITRLLPDVELTAQILVTSILSPKDMTNIELNYFAPDGLFEADLMAKLVERLTLHFEKDYIIRPKLTEMLREALVDKGAYPIAVIPENAIDEFINSDRKVSTEAYSALNALLDTDRRPKPLGVLGSRVSAEDRVRTPGLAQEDYYTKTSKTEGNVFYDDNGSEKAEAIKEEYLIVTDNPMALSISKLNDRSRQEATERIMKTGRLQTALEATITDHQLDNLVYRRRQFNTQPVATIKAAHELGRRSIGNPLIMKLPSESVIPVHVPGNLKQHIGYYVLLDEEGYPLEVADGDSMSMSAGPSSGNNSLQSNLIKRVESNFGLGQGQFDPMASQHMEYANRVYADMVERDLLSRVKNGVHGAAAALAKNEDVYRIMLARVLAKKYTQLLYLPAEFVTYIAFKYTDDGIGRSILDDLSTINVMRSVLMFADVQGATKNSIGRTKVTGTLDPTDPNPMKTISRVIDEVVRSRQAGMLLNVSSPSDIVEHLSKAGYEWNFKGHKGLPEMEFDFVQQQSSYAKPDSDLIKRLDSFSAMGFGISPEMVDKGLNQAEFAATALQDNILLSKRVQDIQEVFAPQLTDHLRKEARNNQPFIEDLKRILTENVKGILLVADTIPGTEGMEISKEIREKLLINHALREFVNGFTAELPKPTSVTLKTQADDLEEYSTTLEKGIAAYMSDEFITTGNSGQVSDEVKTLAAAYKAYFMRKFMAEHGILPELNEITAIPKEGKSETQSGTSINAHLRGLIKQAVVAMAKQQPMKQAAELDLSKMGAEVGGAGDGPDDTTGTGSDEFDTGGGDGLDDFTESTADNAEGTNADEGGEPADKETPAEGPTDDTGEEQTS